MRRPSLIRYGTVFFLAAALLFATAPYVWCATGTVDVTPDGSDEDAEEDTGGTLTTGSGDLDLMYDAFGGDNNAAVGMRFKNITIPRGATITNAYVRFYADESDSGTVNLRIYGEAEDNPDDFDGNTTDEITPRNLTAASVDWDITNDWDQGDEYQTPDISAIVQEIVNRGEGANPGSWSSGNNIVIIIKRNPDVAIIDTDLDGIHDFERVAESRDGDAGRYPLLHIEYTSTVVDVQVSQSSDDAEQEASNQDVNTTSGDLDMFQDGYNMVGIRFQNVQVPQGAVITSAYIQFQADESDSEDTEWVIRGEDADNPPTFTTGDNNIGSRTPTSASVTWDSIPSWTTGNKYQTLDLSAIVQEIAGRGGWATGQSMVFIIEEVSGTRVAESFDGAYAPLLHIEYSEDPVPFISTSETVLGASTYTGSNAPSATFELTNTGSADLNYTITDDAVSGGIDWVSVSPTSGTLAPGASVTIAVTYFTSSLATGTYDATLFITDANAPNSVYEVDLSATLNDLPASTNCGDVPVYTENLVSPAILILMDVSGSMKTLMTVSSAGSDPMAPDLSTIVQEIVDRDTWTANNPMVFILEGTGTRVAVSYDQLSSSAPLLHVEYTSGGTPGTYESRVIASTDDAEEASNGDMTLTSSDLELDQDSQEIIGLRFQDVSIPQGATITSAYLQFTVDEADDEAASWTIWGEDLDEPATFGNNDNNISNRTKTTASVAWSPGAWTAPTQQKRIEIAKDAMKELIEDESVSWGFGTWTGNYSSSIDYTKVHVGVELYSAAHETELKTAIDNASEGGNTPLQPQLVAARKYFLGQKKDDDGAGEYFDTSIDCQPKFLITITDGLGNTGTTLAGVETETTNLLNNDVTGIAVGFGIDDATQLFKMAEVSNNLGGASDDDDVFALHDEIAGVAQPFLANNKDELVAALRKITESIKAAIFFGSAPAPTTSADLGDTVLVASFDASEWSGELEALGKNAATGEFDVVLWKASENIPFIRNVFTIDDTDHTTVVDYASTTLPNDNYLCKDIGDIINSTPLVVGSPPNFYPFDGYPAWARSIDRDPIIYIGSNDGLLHAFYLADGVEQWAFLPEFLQDRINQADNPTFDMCDMGEYCHQFYVDGSPVAADIFDGTDWKTIVLTGLREGGEAYFAVDVTAGEPFFNGTGDQAEYLWEFTDTDLGQAWSTPAISRVTDGGGSEWAVFFGSGPSATDQDNKIAYLYGIVADDKSALWDDGGTATNKVVVTGSEFSTLYYDAKTADFTGGETVTGDTSGATGEILDVRQTDANTGSLVLKNLSGDFQDNELITSAGGSATADGAQVDGRVDDILSSPLTVDLDFNHFADRIYAGNLYGTEYRFDSIGKGETPSITKLLEFDPAITAVNVNPIRAQAEFAYRNASGGIWVYFGTGRYEQQTDKTNLNQQWFFGLKDDLASTDTYTFDSSTEELLLGADVQATLSAGTLTDVVSGADARIITGTNPNLKSWAIKLDASSAGLLGSERVIQQPLVVAGVVFFTTFIPDTDICAGNGETWVYAVDFESGEALDEPVFDLNGDGVVNDQDYAEDANGDLYVPAGIFVGEGQGSYPVLHKSTLFVTTTGEGLKGLTVNLPGIDVELNAWKEVY